MTSSHAYQGSRQGKKMTVSQRFIRTFLCAALLYLGLCAPSTPATLLPNGEQTFVDANGNPLAAGTVDFYVPGGLVRKNTWLSSTATNPNLNANPVVLDSAGRAVIYGIGCYRQIVKNSAGTTQWDKTTCDTAQGSASWGGTATGTPNAIIVTANNFTGTDGDVIRFIAASTNLGATTINPSVAGVAFGNVTVLVDGGTGPIACTGGEIVAGNVITVVYDANLGSFHLSTLTTVTAGAGLSTSGVGSSGGTGATSVTLTTVEPVNAQTGTTYTVLNTDNAKLVTFSNTAAVAVTVPTATGNFAAGFHFDVANIGGGLVTLTPASGTINGTSAITLPSGYRSYKIVSNGSNWFALTGNVTPKGAADGVRRLAIVNNSGSENTQVLITADYAAMFDTSGNSVAATSISVTCNYAVTGANGIDTGALTTSTWYFHWLISNGSTTACLGSLSATAPTMPSGYTFKTIVGAHQTDGSSNFYRINTQGNRSNYKITAGTNTTTAFSVGTGVIGTYSATSPTLTATTVRGNGFCVPSTAASAGLVISPNHNALTQSSLLLAPSTAWGGTNNGPNGSNSQTYPAYVDATDNASSQQAEIILEADTVGIASSQNGGIVRCLFWTNNFNAN